MKIYKHEYNSYKHTVSVIDVEVEEKPKTYVFKQSKGWQTRILKSDIDKLSGYSSKEMFSLSPDADAFLRRIIDEKEKSIEELNARIDAVKKEKENVQKLLEERSEGRQ